MFGTKQIAAGAIFVLLVILLNMAAPRVRSAVFAFTFPLQRALWEQGSEVSRFLYGMFGSKELAQENKELKARVASLLHDAYDLGRIRLENEELQKAFSSRQEQSPRLLPVVPVGKELSRDVLFLDQGEAAGIALGMVVVSANQEAVGVIAETASHSSKVRLISDKDFATDVSLPDREITAVLKGQGNFRLLLDLVPRDKHLEPGDPIFTSSLGNVFPPNLLIGRVETKERGNEESFQRANVTPLFDVSKASILFVILALP
ncbi:MAG: rod shape-determining protein MreC [Parcubacteria group bacterium]|nr:rod shape-determining protein MreC [Parcubacteria group bacterium]